MWRDVIVECWWSTGLTLRGAAHRKGTEGTGSGNRVFEGERKATVRVYIGIK